MINCSHCRIKSRAVIINYNLPGIGPSNEDEEHDRMELETLINSGEMSVLIGWAIEQGESLKSTEILKELQQLKGVLRGVFEGRCCQNWALVMLFLKRVSAMHANLLCHEGNGKTHS